MKQRVSGERVPDPDDFLHKLGAESRLTRFIPCSGFDHVPFHFWPEFDLPVHLPKRERNRALISSSCTAELGFRR